jgi:hypothetical protein
MIDKLNRLQSNKNVKIKVRASVIFSAGMVGPFQQKTILPERKSHTRFERKKVLQRLECTNAFI